MSLSIYEVEYTYTTSGPDLEAELGNAVPKRPALNSINIHGSRPLELSNFGTYLSIRLQENGLGDWRKNMPWLMRH